MDEGKEGFDWAFRVVVGEEGGYVNNPKDPGGETNWGISKRAYPEVDIAGLTEEGAKALYKRDYWDKVRGDELPWGVALALFDGAVNQGVSNTVINLQMALGVTPDAVIGPETLAAAKVMTREQIALFLAHRTMLYMSLQTFREFGKGWLKRVFNVALSMGEVGNG